MFAFGIFKTPSFPLEPAPCDRMRLRKTALKARPSESYVHQQRKALEAKAASTQSNQAKEAIMRIGPKPVL